MLDPLHNTVTAEIRGKLGPWIYYRNSEGPIRRPWQEHRTMSSPAQSAWNLIFKTAALRWNANLTDQQRQAWRKFTDQYPRTDQLHQSYAPSGQNRHAGCNAITYGYAGTFLDDPPANCRCHQPTGIQILTATATPQALTIRMFGTLDPDEFWVLTAAPLRNVGRLNVGNIWRPLAFAQNALPYTYNAIADYTAKFTPLTAGKKLNARLQIANTFSGTISVGITTSATIL